ncbi:MAG: fumarylacetoacetate hydrolase family protein [Rhodospirillaceae bacterium]
MKFVTIDRTPAGRAGALIGSEIVDLAAAAALSQPQRHVPDSVQAILEGGQPALDAVRRLLDEVQGGPDSRKAMLRERGALLPDTTRLLAPLPRPLFILSVGMNYGRHLKEMSDTPPPKEPTAFIKTPHSVTGPGWPIIVPPQCGDMIDWEGEFTFVIGKPCYNVAAKDAMDYVAGYTICNDVSARDWVKGVFEAKSQGGFASIHAWELNIMGKQLPTFTPMGPVVVTKDEVPDPYDLQLTTTLNGEVMQSTKTDDLIFKIPEMIAHFSKWFAFKPGDVVTTGSPSGVGVGRKPPKFMKAGDTVAITIERIGTLSNPLVLAKDAAVG